MIDTLRHVENRGNGIIRSPIFDFRFAAYVDIAAAAEEASNMRCMTLNRATTIVVGGVVLATWLATAAGTGGAREDRQDAAPQVRGDLDPLVAEVQAQAERLRERLSTAPAPTVEPRNPFQFASREPRILAARRVNAPAPVTPEAPPVAEPVRPQLSLVGLAEDDARIRTAVIAGMGELFLVKAGETLTPRFRVDAIGADAVEISDLQTGSAFRLVLK